MTNWEPDLSSFRGPRYRAIADALAADVRAGRLAVGDRLPTHRDLAWRLKVTVGTVTRAYADAERRGLIAGTVGRGTFVRGASPWPETRVALETRSEADLLDLTRNVPPLGEEPALLAETIAALTAEPDFGELLTYQPHAGRAVDREAGAAWIAATGLRVPPERVVVTGGAQHAMAVALLGLMRPGETLAAEALTYPGLRVLAATLNIKLASVAMDEHGARADALEELCRAANGSPVRAVYLTPSINNPTTVVMPEARRRAIAAVAERYDVAVVEDDIYGFLLDDPPPAIASFAPRHGVFIAGTSKSLAPGLRIAYVASAPDKVERIATAMRATMYMATPLTAAVATRWIANGTAERIAAGKRARAPQRQALARAAFALQPDIRYRSHDRAYHVWLELPERWPADLYAAAARRRGVLVTPVGAFAVGRGPHTNAVRLCLGTTPDDTRLADALGRLAALLSEAPDSYLSVV